MSEILQKTPKNKKIYVASDFHLGVPNPTASLERERKIVKWLSQVADNAELIILAGDIFDFWFEYKYVVPKGHIRFLGKLAELRDQGIAILIFAGNHDMWMFDYFPNELQIPVFHEPKKFTFFEKDYLIGHGDGLGPGDKKYKTIKKIFKNPLHQWLFSWLHPNIGFWAANKWSANSKKKSIEKNDPFLHEKEMIFQFCQSVESNTHHDFYVFGHRHLPLEMDVTNYSKYINLGEWITQYNYLEISQEGTKLIHFEG